MKFVANPNRFIFFIGLGIVGFLYMFLYMILSKILLLIPAVLIWIIMSFYFARKNYVEFVILKNKFAIRCAGKKYDVDFADIDYMGQGFADEIFRIYANAHPDVVLRPIHMVPLVEKMVRHVGRGALPKNVILGQ